MSDQIVIPLAVMTYNIHHGASATSEYHLEAVAATIAEHRRPGSIVGLQEVDRGFAKRSGFEDQAALLAIRTGLRGFFGPSMSNDVGSYGCLALTGRTVVNWSCIRLPRRSDMLEPRQLLELILNVAGARLRFMCTHLSLDRLERAMQIQALAERLDGPGSVVLVGDLNCAPDAAELEPLNRRLVDAWRVKGSGEGLTYPTEKPQSRIDYVFVSPDIDVDRIWVPPAIASDHRPIVADLRLRRQLG